jgi:hypothetical protein
MKTSYTIQMHNIISKLKNDLNTESSARETTIRELQQSQFDKTKSDMKLHYEQLHEDTINKMTKQLQHEYHTRNIKKYIIFFSCIIYYIFY